MSKISWTPERVTSLSIQELKNLLENASRKGNQEVVSLCEEELISRKPKPKPIVGMPDGFVRVTRSDRSKIKEADVSHLLVELANKLSLRFDFSTEKARALSVGHKRFIPHKLLDSKGKAKTGGAQKAGRVVFDRYISYRLQGEVFALLGILFNEEDEMGVRYQVLGPSTILTNFKPLNNLRPYLMDGEKIGITPGGEEYSNFEEAATRFTWMIEQVAPKL
jgi:hypothetical protein